MTSTQTVTVDVPPLAPSAPAGATYRIACVDVDDYTYREPNSPGLLRTLKAAQARLRQTATADDPFVCQEDHWIERLNPVGVWEKVGKVRRHVSKTRAKARTKFRVADFTGPTNPVARSFVARDDGVELSVTDFFCGAGGSSTGLEAVPGLRVKMAVNHWAEAIETHQHNVPHADHDQADIAEVAKHNPYRYPKTDLGWFSPECITWSLARGQKVDYDTDWSQPTLDAGLFDPESLNDDPDKKSAKEATQRSRALMGDVPRFAAVHHYKGIIVENVPDILKWVHIGAWLKRMDDLGYNHKIVNLNSAFANALGEGAPQLRDRVYVVFWQKRYRRPDFDKWLRPPAYCPKCDRIVRAVYAPKPGPLRAMRYGSQYVYRCPAKSCRLAQVQPLARPAQSILDFSLPTQVIGERKTPLATKTMIRLAGGIWRHRDRFLAGMAGRTFERHPGVRTWPTTRPLITQHTTESLGLVTLVGGGRKNAPAVTDEPMHTVTATEKDALVVPLEGRDGKTARLASDPLRTQTARAQDGLVQIPGPPAMYVPLRNHGTAAPVDEAPLQTFSAGGTHHALVMRNNSVRDGDDPGYLTTPTGEPLRTIATAGHQSLVQRGVYAYDTGELRPITDPLPTQTTVEGDALVELLGPVIDQCTLRMLAVNEIQAGMAFGDWIMLKATSKRDKVRMLGNAVTPCSARDLGAALMEAITGVVIDPLPYDLHRIGA